MYSALPLTTDIAQQGRHVRSVPIGENMISALCLIELMQD
jgi:hypothetical protein